MNALVTTTPQNEVIRVLQNSLYPGARAESVALVLSYCRVNGIDPMLKPVHIVPTNVKVGKDKWEWRDVLMPGISDYRIKAARTGEYMGKTEPEFGPDVTEELDGVKVTYPLWCRVTVKRYVKGMVCEYTAVERWLENYATAGKDTDAPNKMWKKRAYGQLAKCAEAQALRMAFPEMAGGAPTAEEMEGKHDTFVGTTIESAEPRSSISNGVSPNAPLGAASDDALGMPADPQPKPKTIAEWLDDLERALMVSDTADAVEFIISSPEVRKISGRLHNGARERYDTIIAAARTRVAAPGSSAPVNGEPIDDEIPF